MKYLLERGIETSTSTAAGKFSIEGLRSADPGMAFSALVIAIYEETCRQRSQEFPEYCVSKT